MPDNREQTLSGMKQLLGHHKVNV